eukprot:jgi/Astpho2/2020/e_gw1.00038.290.1_t
MQANFRGTKCTAWGCTPLPALEPMRASGRRAATMVWVWSALLGGLPTMAAMCAGCARATACATTTTKTTLRGSGQGACAMDEGTTSPANATALVCTASPMGTSSWGSVPATCPMGTGRMSTLPGRCTRGSGCTGASMGGACTRSRRRRSGQVRGCL